MTGNPEVEKLRLTPPQVQPPPDGLVG